MTQLFLEMPPAESTGVVHIVVPNMATLCCDDYLTASDRGDRPAINPHLYRADGERERRSRWRNITCPWCRSLGRSYFRWVCSVMQGRDPVTNAVRNTDRERAMLAGIEAA